MSTLVVTVYHHGDKVVIAKLEPGQTAVLLERRNRDRPEKSWYELIKGRPFGAQVFLAVHWPKDNDPRPSGRGRVSRFSHRIVWTLSSDSQRISGLFVGQAVALNAETECDFPEPGTDIGNCFDVNQMFDDGSSMEILSLYLKEEE
jgi:hypothetical protein